jgi:hypothetical protein
MQMARLSRAAHFLFVEDFTMKKTARIGALFVAITLAGCSHQARYYPPPPPAYSAIAQQGFHDGLQAARRDMRHGLPPDPARHARFRRPPVPPPAMEDYRQGFRGGYEDFFHHGR